MVIPRQHANMVSIGIDPWIHGHARWLTKILMNTQKYPLVIQRSERENPPIFNSYIIKKHL